MPRQIIDAHHHLWQYSREDYAWISEEMGALRHNFLGRELEQVFSQNGVSGSVAVQARQTLDETRWLLELAQSTPAIRGVVGWAPLRDSRLEEALAPLAADPKLRGIRHVIQDEPGGFMLTPEFNRGISLLRNFGLTYDVLIYERQLPEAIEFIRRHPQQPFVLDHIAKPNIREGSVNRWKEHIQNLARLPNVTCKLSGMVTEAGSHWNEAMLRPYFDHVLECFKPQRLMFGSDWPVMTLASSYAQWLGVVRDWLSTLTADEQEWIWHRTAKEAYELTDAMIV